MNAFRNMPVARKFSLPSGIQCLLCILSGGIALAGLIKINHAPVGRGRASLRTETGPDALVDATGAAFSTLDIDSARRQRMNALRSGFQTQQRASGATRRACHQRSPMSTGFFSLINTFHFGKAQAEVHERTRL